MRKYIAICIVVTCPLLSLSLASQALADEDDISIPFFTENTPDLSSQEDIVACWAASTSAALKCKGVDISQDSIKLAVNGYTGPAPLTDPSKLCNVVSKLPYKEGKLKVDKITEPAQWITWEKFKKEIKAGNPFITGYWLDQQHIHAHVIVIYGATVDANGRPVKYKIWDPAPGVGLREAPLESFNPTAWFFMIVRGAKLEPRQNNGDGDQGHQDNVGADDPVSDITVSKDQEDYDSDTKTLTFKLTYKNNADKPDRVTVTVKAMPGSTFEERPDSDRPLRSRSFTFTIEPGQQHEVTGEWTLSNARSDNGDPELHYGASDDEDGASLVKVTRIGN